MLTLNEYKAQKIAEAAKNGVVTIPRGIGERWIEQVTNNKLTDCGWRGALMYLAACRRGIKAQTACKFAMLAELMGFPDFAAGFWEGAMRLDASAAGEPLPQNVSAPRLQHPGAVFQFEFAYDDDSAEIYMISILDGPVMSDQDPKFADMETALQQEIEQRDLEVNYGVHDWSGGGDAYGSFAIWGFDTYEVERKKVNELISIWREILTSQGYRLHDYTLRLKT